MTGVDPLDPLRSLADGWDAQAADLRQRATHCHKRAYDLSQLEEVPRLSPNIDELLDAEKRNTVSATMLEHTARQLRESIKTVERLRRGQWAEIMRKWDELNNQAVDTTGNPR